MFQHMAWADERVIASMLSSQVGEEKALVLLGHIIAAEYIWISRIESRDVGSFAPWTQLTLRECDKLSRDNHAAYLRIIQNSTDDDLKSVVQYKTTRGDAMETCLGDILMHVGLHGSYHRGQIAAALKASGVTPPSTDYILYCRQL